MAFYVFSLHIPLSFGGLSVVAQLLNQTHLNPDIQVIQSASKRTLILSFFKGYFRHFTLMFLFPKQALSLLLIQTLELGAFMLLLQFSEKPFNILSFFKTRVFPKERNWLLASVIGLGFLLAFIFLTSFVADKLIGPKVSLKTPI